MQVQNAVPQLACPTIARAGLEPAQVTLASANATLAADRKLGCDIRGLSSVEAPALDSLTIPDGPVETTPTSKTIIMTQVDGGPRIVRGI